MDRFLLLGGINFYNVVMQLSLWSYWPFLLLDARGRELPPQTPHGHGAASTAGREAARISDYLAM